MDSSYSKDFDHAFKLDEDTIRKLHKLLRDRIGNVEIVIECSNNKELSTDKLDELLKYENYAESAIQKIVISARNIDPRKSAYIAFSDGLFKGITVRISGSNRVVDNLSSDIRETVYGIKTWYSWIRNFDLFSTILFSLFVVIVSINLLSEFKWIEVPQNPNQLSEKLGFLLIITFVFAALGGVVTLTKIKNYFFPRAIFLIGKGKDRFDLTERIQWGIIITVILGILLNWLF